MTRKINYYPNQTIASDIKASPLIRVQDLIISGACLILLTPIFLLIGALVKLTSSGPIFLKEERVGRDGRIFKLYKFRTVHVGNDLADPVIIAEIVPTVTKIGKILKHTNLDKLPQLINVFRGEMSLVGPCPEHPRAVKLYLPIQLQILAVRPGITGPASLRHREARQRTSKENWRAVYREQVFPYKFSLDLNYLRQRTVWSDLVLILKTMFVVISGKRRLRRLLRLRNRHFFLFDIFALLVTPALALSLRLDRLNLWPEIGPALALYTVVAVPVKISIFYCLYLYRRFWRYAGVNELFRIAVAVGLATSVLTILFIAVHSMLDPYRLAMYRSVPLIDGLLTFVAVGGSRFALRGLYYWQRQRRKVAHGRRVLVVGAGEVGVMVVRELRANPQLEMEPVAFVDDDQTKLRTYIDGLPVVGAIAEIPKLVETYQIQRIIVTTPSVPLTRHQEIMAICEETGVTTHNLPGIFEILAGYKTISRIPRFEISQLLRREPIEVDNSRVTESLAGTIVLITGAGGSIGSELCRQVARCTPKEIILLGHGENSIFEINLDISLSFPNIVTHPVIVDVRDQQGVNQIVEKYRPNIIFHAAAHKHVPYMENHVDEAIANNIIGTRNVLQAAERHGVERFVLISTDKAVNPTSIMGATKRMAELLVIAAARRSGRAYVAVRFGNVLGSRGSVLRVFQRQIGAGGPLTITHPDMYRFFMTIPEAVQLVLQAVILGRGGEAFVLDMGQPVRILDMAKDLIKLHGLGPGRDIKIIYSGIRPGEKLREELFMAEEEYQPTKHPKILVATHKRAVEAEALEQVVLELAKLAKQMQNRNDAAGMLDLLPKICYYIDQYQPRPQPTQPTSTDISKPLPPKPRTQPVSSAA